MATAELTITPRLARLITRQTVIDAIYWTAVVILAAAVGINTALHGLHLLRSAGVIPSTGAISGLTNLITTAMNSIKWFAATIVGVSLSVIAAMFIMGHQSAHQHALRVGLGIIGLVCIPGIIA